jgi:hypothetical protein
MRQTRTCLTLGLQVAGNLHSHRHTTHTDQSTLGSCMDGVPCHLFIPRITGGQQPASTMSHDSQPEQRRSPQALEEPHTAPSQPTKFAGKSVLLMVVRT